MTHGVVILLWLGLCAVQDMRQRQIANRLTLGAGLLALLYVVWTGTTWLGASAGEGAWAVALALLLGLPGYALGRFGAGDVKVLATLGLASSSEFLLGSLIGAGLALGVWALIRQGLSSRLAEPAAQVSTKQPFAPFVLTGFVVCWLWIH